MGSKTGKLGGQDPDHQHCQDPGPQSGQSSEGLGNVFKPGAANKLKLKPCKHFLKIIYVILGIVTAIVALALLAVSIITAVATKIFTNEQSGRLVAMILLAVTAAACLTTTIYSSIAVFKKKGGSKALKGAASFLLALAIIQAIISGLALKVTVQDEIDITRSMEDSFKLAYNLKSSKHERIWSTVQYELDCCGIYSADDFRDGNQVLDKLFPPNVPIACCPGYDPTRSVASQENARDQCKSSKTYHTVGCRHLIVELLRSTSASVLAVVIVLIILEVAGTILVTLISLRKKNAKKNEDEESKQSVSKDNSCSKVEARSSTTPAPEKT